MTRYCRLLVIVLVALLTGCATLMSLNNPDNINSRYIFIQEPIKMPDAMYYWGKQQSIATALGAGLGGVANINGSVANIADGSAAGAVVGAAGGVQASRAPADQLIAMMQQNQINIPQMFRDELVYQIASRKNMTFVDTASEADAVLDIQIELYGLSQTQGFSSVLYPMMKASVTFRDKAGNRMAVYSDYVSPLRTDNEVNYPEEEFLKDPEKLRFAMWSVINLVTGSIAEDIPAPARQGALPARKAPPPEEPEPEKAAEPESVSNTPAPPTPATIASPTTLSAPETTSGTAPMPAPEPEQNDTETGNVWSPVDFEM